MGVTLAAQGIFATGQLETLRYLFVSINLWSIAWPAQQVRASVVLATPNQLQAFLMAGD
jgi:hypothetical protein